MLTLLSQYKRTRIWCASNSIAYQSLLLPVAFPINFVLTNKNPFWEHLIISKIVTRMENQIEGSKISDEQITLRSFIDETSLHGLKGACDVKYSKRRRVIWCVVLALMSGLLITALSLTVQEFLRFVPRTLF